MPNNLLNWTGNIIDNKLTPKKEILVKLKLVDNDQVAMMKLFKALILLFVTTVLVGSPYLLACEAKKEIKKNNVNSSSDIPAIPASDQETGDSESSHEDAAEENEQVSESKKAEEFSESLTKLNLYFTNMTLNNLHTWNGHNSKHRPNRLFKPPIASLL